MAQKPGWAADTGSSSVPPPQPSPPGLPLAEGQREPCQSLALPGPAVRTGPAPAELALFPGPRSVPATQERVSTHLLEAYVTPGLQVATGGGESRAPPSANRGPVPPGPTARGQVQRESWELGAAGCSPRPRTRGRGQWAPPSPGNDRPGTRPGEQLSLGVPPGRRAQSAVQGADHPRCPGCPRSLPCLRGNLTRWEGPVGRPPDAWGPERRGPALPADQAFGGKASGKGEQGPSPCPLRGKLGDALATPTNE